MDDFEHLKRLCERRKQVGSVPWIAGNKSSMNAKVEIDRIDGLIVEEVMKLYEKDDVAEVVRCRDCIHAPLPGDCEGDIEWPKIDGIYEDCTCPHFCDDNWYSARPDPEGFCEKGERRADNGDE